MSGFARAERRREERAAVASLTPKPPVYVDLVDYVKVRTRCSTNTAEVVLLQGCLRSDSHVLGRKEVGGRTVVDRYVLKSRCRDIQVISPEEADAQDA